MGGPGRAVLKMLRYTPAARSGEWRQQQLPAGFDPAGLPSSRGERRRGRPALPRWGVAARPPIARRFLW
jgi:hypothetical protein